MTTALKHDEAARAGQQMAENLAGAAPWLREWGFIPTHDHAAGAGNDMDMRLNIDRYRVPDVETLLVNAHRVRVARQALLDSGAISAKDWAAVRGCSLDTAHKQIRRAYKRNEIVTVTTSGEVRVPAVLLDEALDVRDVWQPVISSLREARLTDWSIWGWMVRPNAGLSGEVAAEVIASDPDRVYSAAHRRMVRDTS